MTDVLDGVRAGLYVVVDLDTEIRHGATLCGERAGHVPSVKTWCAYSDAHIGAAAHLRRITNGGRVNCVECLARTS